MQQDLELELLDPLRFTQCISIGQLHDFRRSCY